MKSLSHVLLLATPWTAAFQAPPSMGFSRQEYWGSPRPEQPLGRGSALSRLGAELELRRTGSSLGSSQYCSESNSSAVSSSWCLCGNGLIRNQGTEYLTFGREEAEVCRMGCFPGGQMRAPMAWQDEQPPPGCKDKVVQSHHPLKWEVSLAAGAED